jgi:hypothetical protein
MPMNRKLVYLSFILCFLFAPFLTTAQIKLNLSNVPKKKLKSGSTQTIVLNITNSSADTLVLGLKNSIPKPLKALIFTKKVKLLPKQRKNILVPISLPKKTKAGNYNLTFALTFEGSIIASKALKIEVQKVTDIEIRLISKPPYGRSGEEVPARFMVINNGNSHEELFLESRNCIIKGSNVLDMSPDTTVFVDVILKTDPDLYRVDDRAIDLQGKITGYNIPVSDQDIIRIYPSKSVKRDPWFRYPITLSTNYIGRKRENENFQQSFQYVLSGNGFLDQKQDHHLQFLYTGPQQINIARIGNFSQKHITYRYKKSQIFVGQKTFGLSGLSEGARYGSGLEFSQKIGESFESMIYYAKPQFMPELRQQVGVKTIYNYKNKIKNTLNFLNSDFIDTTDVQILTLESAFTDNRTWNVRTEIAQSVYKSSLAGAYSLASDISIGGFRLAGSGLYASNEFKGYYNNSVYVNTGVSYNFKKIGFQGGFNYNDANPSLDTVFSAAPYSLYYNAGMVGRFTKKTRVQLQGIHRRKIDRLNDKRFDYMENRVRLDFSYAMEKVSINFQTESGTTQNFLHDDPTNNTSFGYDAQMRIGYTPRSALSFMIFSQYLNNIRYGEQQTGYLLYGLDATWKYRKRLSLNIDFQNNFLIEDLYNDRNLLNVSTRFNINEHQSINALLNYGILHQQPQQRDIYFSINYRLIVGVPLKKVLALGRVQGQLENKGVESVAKIVLLMDGQLTTTDEEGNFVFENVKPGTQTLIIDQRSIGVKDLTDIKLPIEVTVNPDLTTTVNIGMVRAGGLKGVVAVKEVRRMVQSSNEDYSLPRAIIEVSNGVEKFMTQTDGQGNYTFGSLRPGTWTVKIIPTYWKSKFKVTTETFQVELKSGTIEEVAFELVPKFRQIRFKSNKSIKVGGK